MASRYTCSFVVAALLVACAPATTPEPDATELAAKGIANLMSAQTVHVEGTFRLESVQLATGSKNVITAEMTGDSELPDSTRTHVRILVYGIHFETDTITVAGRAYAKDAHLQPQWHEASRAAVRSVVIDRMLYRRGIHDVVEIDRPQIDGQVTRHLRYRADPADAKEMTDLMSLGLPRYATSDAQISTPQGTGELWIRIDDSQIVRQLVNMSFTVELPPATARPGASPTAEKEVTELSLDLRLSRHGVLIPEITAPPIGSRL